MKFDPPAPGQVRVVIEEDSDAASRRSTSLPQKWAPWR